MFTYFDEEGVDGKTAGAQIELNNGENMAIYAGGPGTHSWPAVAPFENYEVLIDRDPQERFWKRYTDSVGALYANVPRLLVTHHIIRSGGLISIRCETATKQRFGMLIMKLMVPEGTMKQVQDAIMGTNGTQILSSSYIAAD